METLFLILKHQKACIYFSSKNPKFHSLLCRLHQWHVWAIDHSAALSVVFGEITLSVNKLAVFSFPRSTDCHTWAFLADIMNKWHLELFRNVKWIDNAMSSFWEMLMKKLTLVACSFRLSFPLLAMSKSLLQPMQPIESSSNVYQSEHFQLL